MNERFTRAGNILENPKNSVESLSQGLICIIQLYSAKPSASGTKARSFLTRISYISTSQPNKRGRAHVTDKQEALGGYHQEEHWRGTADVGWFENNAQS
jgi:hypothetical protein